LGVPVFIFIVKGGMKNMKINNFVWVRGAFLLVFLFQGCALMPPTPAGTVAPIITHSYAIERGRFGDTLKFYIEADDPDNDMFRIATVVDQVGYGLYYTDWMYVKPQYSGHFAGYLQWNTFSSRGDVPEWQRIILKVSVFDKAGRESNVAVFPFEFISEVIKNPPPPAPFDQANLPRLGHIFVELYNPARESGSRIIPDD
jgi:hypothetical protein